MDGSKKDQLFANIGFDEYKQFRVGLKDVENIDDKEDDFGQTLLMTSAAHNRKKFVKKLLKRGANVNLRDKKGRTALILALNSGHFNDENDTIIKMLLERGASPYVRDDDGKNILDSSELCFFRRVGIETYYREFNPLNIKPAVKHI